MLHLLKKEIAELTQTAKKETRKWIVSGLGILLLSFLYVVRNYLLSVLKPILTTPIISWHTPEILFLLLSIIVVISFTYLLSKETSLKSKSRSFIIPTVIDKSKYLSKPTAKEITEKIGNQIPFLRQETANAYIGFHIHWVLSYHAIELNNNSNFRLVRFDPLVEGYINIEDHPEIKAAAMETEFEIWGQITAVIVPFIRLSIHDIKLYNPENKTRIVWNAKGVK